jgi:hypothetical protein
MPGFLVTSLETVPDHPGVRVCGYQTLNAPGTPRSTPAPSALRSLARKISLRSPAAIPAEPVAYASSVFLTPTQALQTLPGKTYRRAAAAAMLPPPSLTAISDARATLPNLKAAHRHGHGHAR